MSQGLEPVVAQCGISFNVHRGTLRGLHFQKSPHEEAKLVRCTMGKVFDVILDLRADSPTFRRWYGTELSVESRMAIYIPRGFAHGFLTLENGSEILYQMSEKFFPDCASGVRWDDPFFAIDWPNAPTVISSRDSSYLNFVLEPTNRVK
jgi:dTDP-4-dehydrorhamnose 3,5-epimerase